MTVQILTYLFCQFLHMVMPRGDNEGVKPARPSLVLAEM
jgi:hypothetical protein